MVLRGYKFRSSEPFHKGASEEKEERIYEAHRLKKRINAFHLQLRTNDGRVKQIRGILTKDILNILQFISFVVNLLLTEGTDTVDRVQRS